MRKLATIVAAVVALLSTAVAFTTQPAGAQGARIHLLHGIPGVDVDVEAGGSNVFEGFSFGDTQDLSSLAGETLTGLKVKVAGTDTVAIEAGDVELPGSGNYTVIAHLDGDGTPSLAVFENDTSTIAAGSGRIVVRHAAAAPAVDITANGDVAFSNVLNGQEGSADLGAGTISAGVVPTGETSPVVIGPADLPITDGSSLIVYAVGSLADETLTVLTESIADLGSAPAAVNTGNSPVGQSNTALVVVAGLAAAVALGFAPRLSRKRS